MSARYQILLVFAAVTLVAAGGIAASFRIADHVRETERVVWLSSAKAEAASATDQLISKLYRTEVNIRALSGRFRAGRVIEPNRFRMLIDEAQTWDPDIEFAAVAFAERLDRPSRNVFESLGEKPLTVVGDPDGIAPEVSESYGVRLVSPPDDLIRPHTDLATHKALRTTIKAATRLPGNAILGPSFVGSGDRRQIPVAITADIDDTAGVIVALLDLQDFIADTVETQTSPGLDLRLIERDSEAGATTQRTAIVGELSPPADAITNVIRLSQGMARWSLYWDIAPDYRGGLDNEVENITRIGGSVISIILAAALGYLATASLRFRQQVREKTAELSRKAMIIQLTMDSIDQGFAVWNSDNRLVVWSRRCLDFWYDPGDWLVPGVHMRRLLTHIAEQGAFGPGKIEEVVERELERIVNAGANSQENFQLVNGTHVHIRRFPLEHGGHVTVYTDVSAQQRAIGQLEQARSEMEDEVRRRTRDLIVARDQAEQASRAKSNILANVSHELRTPLNAIIGFSEMIGINFDDRPLDRNSSEYAGYIKRAGEDLLSIVGDLLDLSRIEAGMFEIDIKPTDVGDIVRSVVDIVEQAAGKPGVDISTSIPNHLPALDVDEHRLRQIMINLVDNGVKFSKESGKVSVSVQITPEGEMMIRVVDDGIGISAEDLSRVSEPFAQVQDVMVRTHVGAGLGLSLAKSLTELMNGRFQVDSELDKGTTVTLTFPRSQIVSDLVS